YEAHGVKEYWLVDPKKQTVEQYVLINGQYYARFKGRDGEIESEVLPGFLLEAEAIFDQKATNQALLKLLA
nr:Uma2 family endonuclease [Spirosomataceae bacterium]